MTVRPWLKDFCAKLTLSSHSRSRRPKRSGRALTRYSSQAVEQSLETLEDRTLLAASVIFGFGELQILTDANETVLIRENPTTPGRVDVQIGTTTTAATTAPSLPNVSTADVTSIVLITGSGDNTIDLSGVLASAFTGLASISVQGGNGNDVIIGSPDLAMMVEGQDGDDLITGGSADDTILGGDGADTISGQAGNDSIDAGDGDDVVTGDDGDDTILADDGNDTVSGNLGNDSILGGDGLDSLSGNEGLDTVNGNSGDDTISGDQDADFLLGGGGADLINGGDDDDTILGQSGRDTLLGDGGADFVDGGSAADSIEGGTGNDTLNGMAGADTVVGRDGDDVIFGGADGDMLFGDSAGTIVADSGNDLIEGQGGNDTIQGGVGTDTLRGGDGDDFIESGDASFVNPVQVTIGDAVSGPESNAENIFFSNSNSVSSGLSFPDAIETADVDNDGDLDLIAGDAGLISVMLNTGSGAFAAGVTYAAGITNIEDIALADFDSDGDLDIVSAGFFGTTLGLIMNLGNGTFSAPATLTSSESLSGETIDVGDFNSDGFADIVVVASTITNPSVFTFLNDGAGGFNQVTAGALGGVQSIEDLVVADFNNDGSLDIAVINDFINETVVVLTNNGLGNFTTISTVAIPGTAFLQHIESADIDNDGDIDLAVSDSFGNNDIFVLRNNGGGSMTLDQTLTPTTTFGSDGFTFGDFNGDGFTDILTSDDFSNPDQTIVFINDGTGTYSTVLNFPNNNFFSSFNDEYATGDFDADGDLDYVTVGAFQSVEVFLNNPTPAPTLSFPVRLSAPSTVPVTVDFRTVENTALSGTDFIANAGTITFQPGEVLQTIRIQAIGDTLPEQDEVFFVELSNPTGAAVISDRQAQGLISDDDGGNPLPTIAITSQVLPAEGNGTNTTVVLTVNLSAVSTNTVTVEFETGGLTAISNVDFVQTMGTVTFAPGETTQTVSVDVVGDRLFEADETFAVNLLNPVNATLSTSAGIVTITNDDSGVIQDSDFLFGGAGNDTLLGSSGDDFLNGNSGDDSLSGAEGNDTLLGGGGDDTLSGGMGNDVLNGQSGNDVVNGDEGEDVIVFGGTGDGLDTVDGGSGSDTVQVNGTSGNDTFSVAQDALGLLTVSQGIASITIDPSSVQTVTVNGLAGNDFIGIGDLDRVGRIVLIANGGFGNDTIDAGGSDTGSVIVQINGEGGDDTLAGGLRDDQINGGIGDDSVIGGEGDDTLSGNDGQDIIAGGLGDDLIRGDAGNDTLSGDEGDDSIDGGLDSDVITGGDGNDTLRGNFGDDALNGMAGDDSILGSSGRDTLAGGAGNDTLDGGRNDDRIRGQSGDDVIRGDHGDDFITGDAGNDEIIGEDGNDTIMGGDGEDGISGGDGDDFIEGQGMNDIITGGDGNDTLRGGGGNDTILGEQGDDVINGNSGTDTAATGEGADAPTTDVEVIDEGFMLDSAMMMKLDGV
ncbi:MAG: VCBS repeat-containing protein [Planctomycetaceae bacterium]|nr:VCBS repeat-containing protein [Planctomycetaceae bacterium]